MGKWRYGKDLRDRNEVRIRLSRGSGGQTSHPETASQFWSEKFSSLTFPAHTWMLL